MKNHLQEAMKAFMKEHDLKINEKFMLFENNTQDDTYYGTYEIQNAEPIENYRHDAHKEKELELICRSFPTLLDMDYEPEKILTEMLEGEYEVRVLKNKENTIKNNKEKPDHMWFGHKRPTHVQNIKEWTNLVEDCVSGDILKEAFQQLYETAVQKKPDEGMQEHIFYAAEELKQTFIETARKHGIPVWYPTADNYNF